MKKNKITTKEDARDKAIAWQQWQSGQDLSYQETADWQDYFFELAEKFDLTDEFKENGII